MNNISTVLFDFDDTLMATRERRVEALIETGSDLGADISPRDIDRHWGKPFKKLINGIAPSVEYERFYSHYMNVMKEYESQVQPAVREVFTLLQSKHIPIFVVSAGSHDLVKQDLEDGGLWRYVSRLWGYEDTPAHKPDPHTLTPVLQHLETINKREGAVPFIGDSPRDLEVARGNGLPFWAVLTGLSDRSDFRSAGLDDNRILDSLHGLLEPDSEFLNAIEH